MITKEQLYDMYICRNYTAKCISETLKVDVTTIYNWLKKYDIKKPKSLKNSNISNKMKLTMCDTDKKKDIIAKRKATCLSIYGVDEANKSDIIKQKIKDTCMKRYGVDNASKSEEVKQKLRKPKKNG